jgi:ACS family pantothenate transporter-like MFS transporter
MAKQDEKQSVQNSQTDPIQPAVSDRDDASATAAAALKQETPAPAAKSGWLQWHEPGTSPEEKKLIFKLDWFLLSFSCVMFFIKQVCPST